MHVLVSCTSNTNGAHMRLCSYHKLTSNVKENTVALKNAAVG